MTELTKRQQQVLEDQEGPGQVVKPVDQVVKPVDQVVKPVDQSGQASRPPSKKETRKKPGKEIEKETVPFSVDSIAGLPIGIDAHQRHIDATSGGQSLDPVLEVAKHLRWGCTGGAGIPLPRGKGKGEYTDAAKKLLDDTDADDWRAVCAAVDGWFEHPPDEDIWMHERAKKPHFALAQIADYWRTMHGEGKKKSANGRASPTSSWLSEEDLRIADADVKRRLAEMEARA